MLVNNQELRSKPTRYEKGNTFSIEASLGVSKPTSGN